MTGSCTCGARLPPDARFCHKCGKPLFDYPAFDPEPEVETAPPDAPPPLPPPAEAQVPAGPPAVNMRNPVAVRTAFLAGAGTAIILMIPMPALMQILWQFVMLLGGGFFAVWLYQRRTGFVPGLGAGARLGWIAGLFCFLIMMIMFTLSMIAIAAGGGIQQSFQELLSMRGSPEVAEQFENLLASPGGTAFLIFGMLLTSFFMLTLLPAAGGALGAKVLEKD